VRAQVQILSPRLQSQRTSKTCRDVWRTSELRALQGVFAARGVTAMWSSHVALDGSAHETHIPEAGKTHTEGGC
jgi:hypothetical protein